MLHFQVQGGPGLSVGFCYGSEDFFTVCISKLHLGTVNFALFAFFL